MGDRDGSTCEPEFTAFVATALAAMDYSVAINDPYKGVELVRKHGRPAERRHSLQIEINRKLYMDEATLERRQGFSTLQANLNRLLQATREFILRRIQLERVQLAFGACGPGHCASHAKR